MVQGVSIVDGYIQNLNPATGELIEPSVAVTTPVELEGAVATANEAQAKWSSLPLQERVSAVRKGLEVAASAKPVAARLRDLITREMGKVPSEAEEEVSEVLGLSGSWLDMVREANEDEVLGSPDGAQSVIVRDPLGVVAVLGPWNFPVGELPLLAVPALVAGNAVIVKPSEVAPLSGQAYCAALAGALPPGVLQTVQGDGHVGRALVEHEGVHMVAMTGSSAVGRQIMESCARSLKRLVLELGGKDPMVVFADADLDSAAKDAVTNSLSNAGQVCCSIERVYVEESAEQEFLDRCVREARRWKVGDPAEAGVAVGPLVSRVQLEHVRRQVRGAREAGARVAYESAVPEDGGRGHYHPVTVLRDVRRSMDLQRSETFGPVVSVATFDGTEDAAVTAANDTEYGLAACVYTADPAKGARVGRRIRSGQVGINCYSLAEMQPQCPWVGHKQSGFGSHSGMDGWRSFSAPKSLVFNEKIPS